MEDSGDAEVNASFEDFQGKLVDLGVIAEGDALAPEAFATQNLASPATAKVLDALAAQVRRRTRPVILYLLTPSAPLPANCSSPLR